MRCQLSDADIHIASYILHRVRKLISQDEFDQLEATLATTNYFKQKTTKQRNDTLWGFCAQTILQVFQENCYKETIDIIDVCKKLEGIDNGEIDILERIRDAVEDIISEINTVKTAFLATDVYILLDHPEKAISCLLEQKSQKRLSKKEKTDVLIKLNELYDDSVDYDNVLSNLEELIRIQPRNLEVFNIIINSIFISEDAIQGLAIKYLSENVHKQAYWKSLITVYNWEFIAKTHIQLGYPFVPVKAVLLDILDAYKSIESKKSWSVLVAKIKENSLWDDDFEYKLATCYYSDNDLKNAEKTLKGLLLKEGTNIEYLKLLGSILRLQEKYSEAARVFRNIDKAGLNEDANNAQLFYCYAADNKELKAKKVFDEKYGGGIPQRVFRDIYTWIGNEKVPDKLLFDCLENKSVIPRQKQEFWRDFDYFFRQIFDDSLAIEGNGELKVKLLELHKNIALLKKKLQLDYMRNEFIYHYSPISSIISLTGFRDEPFSRFQVGNVSYMNDPGEGQAFTRILEEFSEKKTIESIMEKLYGKDNITYRKTFLSSFTLRRDFLPMWIQYAKDGFGCCYKLSTREFGTRSSSLEKQVTKFKRKSENNKKDIPVLYQVYYFDKDLKDDPKIASCRKIAEILVSLNEFFKYSRVQAIVSGMLDEIRYLFKSSDYQTEEEVRIVCTDFEQEALRRLPQNNTQPPQMYLELNVDFNIRELMLGPRVKDVKEWAAYLKNCSNVGEVSVSGIQYK